MDCPACNGNGDLDWMADTHVESLNSFPGENDNVHQGLDPTASICYRCGGSGFLEQNE